MGRVSQMLGAFAAVAMVLAAAGATLTFTASGASAAGTHKSSPQVAARPAKLVGEQFRGDVQTWLNGLRGVVIQMRANPAFDAPAASPLRGAAKGAPGGPLAPTSGTGTFTDDCESAGDPYAEDIAVLTANEVQSGLVAAYFAVPGLIAAFTDINVPTGLRIGLAIAWGVANGVYLALAQTLAVAVDCAATAFGNTQVSTLPHEPAGSANPVARGSTQFSIDRLIAKAGNTQATIAAVQATVQTVETQTDTVDTAVTALNNILNDITNRVDDVQTGLQTLQANVDVLQNTEVTILKKADTEIANLGTFQDLQLRMQIEDNLDRTEK